MKSLLDHLKDDSPEVRRRAVLEARRLPAAEAAEIVIEALGDEDWRVRKEAALYAAEIAHTGDVAKRLIDATAEDENIGLRNAALEALANSGEGALDQVVERVSSEQPDHRRTAVEILGSSKDPRAVDLLVRSLGDKDPNVRACAAEWLGEFDERRAADALISCLKPEDRLLSLVALQSLRKMNAAIPWDVLQPLVDDPLLGDELILALGRTRAVAAVFKVSSYLGDEPAACRAMVQLHESGPDTAAAVETALHDISDGVAERLRQWAGERSEHQRAAARCLLWTRNRAHMSKIVTLARNNTLYAVLLEDLERWGSEVVAALLALLDEVEGDELASTIGLLTRLMDDAAGAEQSAVFAALLASERSPVATAAAGAVARFGDHKVIPRLMGMVARDDKRLRTAAGNALAEIGRRHPDAVYAALADVEIAGAKGVEVCRALRIVGNRMAAPRVVVALNDPDPELRQTALCTLATLDGEEAIGPIVARLTDEEVGVRLAAVEALALVGPPARETIVAALAVAEGPVASALIRALGRVGHPDAAEILGRMSSRSADVAVAAIESAQALGIHLERWQDEIFSHNDAEVVKRALSAFKENIPLERLAKLTGHPAWDVRLAAVRQLEPTASVPAVAETLRDRLSAEDDDLVRAALTEVLNPPGGSR